MPLNPFKLERYFAQYEFKVKYLLSASDCESLPMAELLDMASPESLELWRTLKLGYTESAGHPLLLAEISRLYQGIQPEQVITAAPEEAIFIAMHTLLAPGDEVVAVSPAYQSLHEIARAIGCRLIPWQLRPGADGWQLDLNDLERSLSARTRLLILNFPHNPTGFLPNRADFDAILELARNHGVVVFSDEMYRLLENDPADRLPSICDVYEKGIALSGLSKSFALPGLRLGWLASQMPGWVERWLTFKDYTTICSSAPSEILGIIALQNRERITKRNTAIIAANTAHAGKFFDERREQFTWVKPRAGSVAFPRWLGPGSVEQLCQDVLNARGVMIVPGSLFDYPGEHFRIGLGRANFPGALQQVGEYLS